LKSLQLQTALTEVRSQSKQLSLDKAELEKKLSLTQEVMTKLQLEQNSERDQIRRLQAELTTRTRNINNCESKNRELYKSGRDLIEQCQIQTIGASSPAQYPQTGMKRVSIENLLEIYRDKLDDEKLVNMTNSP
jgi:chromosome segregation ATPase